MFRISSGGICRIHVHFPGWIWCAMIQVFCISDLGITTWALHLSRLDTSGLLFWAKTFHLPAWLLNENRLVQDGAPEAYYKWIKIPGYTHLQPWLNRVCWGYNYLITRLLVVLGLLYDSSSNLLTVVTKSHKSISNPSSFWQFQFSAKILHGSSIWVNLNLVRYSSFTYTLEEILHISW